MFKRRRRIKAANLIKLSASAFYPGIILLLAYEILIKSGLYTAYPWVDNPLHLMGAAIIARAAFVFWAWGQRKRLLPRLPYWVAVAFAVGIAAIVGIIWEQYEFLWDLSNGSWLTPNVADFIKDLTNDLLGAFVFAVFAAKRMLDLKRK